jgi:hypothetical protein
VRAFSIIFILSILFSCNQENENSDSTIIIGESNKNYDIIRPNPEIVISKSHQDSLDLNSDGIFEIKFIISPIPTSTVPGSKTEISAKNKLQILLSVINEYPDTLSIKSVLNSDSNWSGLNPDWTGSESFTFLLQSYACYTYFHCVGWGNFRNSNGKYVGYKIGEKFGWILVDSSQGELKISEYTVLK